METLFLWGDSLDVHWSYILKYLFDQKELKMWQRRLVEFIRDDDFEIKYPLEKVNNDLEYNLLEKFKDLNLNINSTQEGVFLNQINILCDIMKIVRLSHVLDMDLQAQANQLGYCDIRSMCVLND